MPTYFIIVSLDVNNLLLKVGDLVIAHWHKFGLAIGVPKEFLDQISGEDNKCLTQVLEYWVKHHPGKPTWEEVTDAQKKTLDQLQFELAGMEGKQYYIITIHALFKVL